MRARVVPAIGAALVIALGLASRKIPLGIPVWDKSLGDVLYAVMVSLLAATIRPDARPRTLAGIGLAVSAALEVFQLTEIPARAPRVLQLVLGTTFAWHDMACYVVGGAAAWGLHALLRRRSA